MNILLDTHTFMWWDSRSAALSAAARDAIADEDNVIYLSVVSVWEIQIKHQLGKLSVAGNLGDIVDEHITQNNFRLLPVLLQHVLELDSLPMHHRDPFDRLLIAQARIEEAVLVTRDKMIRSYDVNTLWD